MNAIYDTVFLACIFTLTLLQGVLLHISVYTQSTFKLHSVYIQCEGFATLTFCNSTLLQGFGVIGANPDGGPSEVDKGGTACLLFLFCCMLACVVKFVASSVGLNNQVMVARHAVLDSQSMVQTCYHRVFKKGVHSGGEMAAMGEIMVQIQARALCTCRRSAVGLMMLSSPPRPRAAVLAQWAE